MRTPASPTIDLSKYIEIRDERPFIRGRRLPVIFVAKAEQTNRLSIEELAYQFTLSAEQVLAALLYYYEHRDEMDAQDIGDARASQELHDLHGKKPGQR